MSSLKSLSSKAQTLASTGALAAIATVAANLDATPIDLSFAGQGLYDNSGFFVGSLDSIDNGGDATIPGGFKLYGEGSLSDSDFYEPDFDNELRPIFDGDGLGFLWGGDVTGDINAGDIFNIDIDLSYTYTHTQAYMYDDPYVDVYATFGIFDNYGSTVDYNDYFSAYNGLYTEFWSDETSYAPGTYDVTGSMELEIYEGDFEYDNPTNWYLIVYVSWEHENDSFNYDAPFPKLNGDTLSVTIPDNSIDLTYESALGVIPEPASMSLLVPLFVGGLVISKRRRKRTN